MISLYGWHEVWIQERPGRHAELMAIVKGVNDARAVQNLYPDVRCWIRCKNGNPMRTADNVSIP